MSTDSAIDPSADLTIDLGRPDATALHCVAMRGDPRCGARSDAMGDVRLSFADLRQAVDRCKQRLVRVPDSICILPARRHPAFIIAFLALYELGMPVAVFAPEWTPAEAARRRRCLGRWTTAARVLDPELGRQLGGPLDDEGDHAGGNEGEDGPGSGSHGAREAAHAPAIHHPDTAVVLFTSGSTGEPRGVQLSRANIEASIAAVRASLDFDDVDRQADQGQVLFLPLHYSFGLLGQLLPALRAGVGTRLLDNLVQLKALADQGALAGMVSGVPSHLETLVRLLQARSGSCPGVSHVVSAGAALHPALRRRLLETFPRSRVYSNYGQTELSPRALCLRSDHARFLGNATGYPVGRLAARLTGEGELCIRGDQVMLGYLGAPEATRAAIVDGWLHTGDLATMDEDGLVTVLGRNDDLFQLGGERMGPGEIEAALRALPGVVDAAVTQVPDALYGTALVALLQVEHPGAAARLRAADLRHRLRADLSPHKIPGRFYLVDRLPRTASGKLQRAHLAALLVDPARALP